MSQHLWIGPQGERVVCDSEEEARSLGASKRPVDSAAAVTGTDRDLIQETATSEDQNCPTCGRPFPGVDDEDDEDEDAA